MDKITSETTIKKAVHLKGEAAYLIIDSVLCEGKYGCCANTSVQLGYAAEKMEKSDKLPALLDDLNKLPDVKSGYAHVHQHQTATKQCFGQCCCSTP